MAVTDQSHRAVAWADVQTPHSPTDTVSLRHRWSDPWLVVEAAGEMDLQAVPLLNALGRDHRFVVFDLHGVTFMDCSCLRSLLFTRCEALALRGSVSLVAASPSVLRLLKLTRLERAFPTFDTVPEATEVAPGVGKDRSQVPVRPRRSSVGRQRSE